MSVGTAERADSSVAPEVAEPITAGAAALKAAESLPDPQPVQQRPPVVAPPPAEPPVVVQPLSNNPYRGADPGGWTDLLNAVGLGPYELLSVPDYEEALRVAAMALRDTGRPVGLVMWRGRHAWVMSGFESTGDPSLRDDFEVTGIRVVDPLYPYGSGTWGPSPEPNQLLTKEDLAKQFVFREKRSWSSNVAAGFLLVLPAAEVVAGRDVTGGPGTRPLQPQFEAQ